MPAADAIVEPSQPSSGSLRSGTVRTVEKLAPWSSLTALSRSGSKPRAITKTLPFWSCTACASFGLCHQGSLRREKRDKSQSTGAATPGPGAGLTPHLSTKRPSCSVVIRQQRKAMRELSVAAVESSMVRGCQQPTAAQLQSRRRTCAHPPPICARARVVSS